MYKVAGILGLVLLPTVLQASEGEALYLQHCAQCHGEAGVSKMTMIPNIKGSQMPAAKIKDVIMHGLDTGRTMSMPPMAGLKENEIEAITGYVEHLKSGK